MPTTCQEFRDGDIDTNDNVVVDCLGDLTTPSPISLGGSFNISVRTLGNIDLPDLTTAGGFIKIESTQGDITLNKVDSGSHIEIISDGKVTIKGIIKADANISIGE